MDESNDSLNCSKRDNGPDQAAPGVITDEEETTERTEPQPALFQTESTAGDEREAPVDGSVNPLAEPPSPGPKKPDSEEQSKGVAASRLIAKLGGKKRAAIMACAAVAVILFLPAIFPQLFCSHDSWKDATCTEPRTCESCGKTDGEPLGHDWSDATCTEPKTCARCGVTEGEPLGHKLEDWKDDGFNSTFSERVYIKTCSRCEKIVERKTEEVASFLENEKLTICPDTYSKVFEKRLQELNDGDFTVREEYDYKLTVYSINDSNEEMAGQLSFSLKGENLDPTLLYTKPLNYGIVIMLDNNQSGYDKEMARFLVAMIEACDPSFDWDSVGEIIKEIDEQGTASRNGFTYSRTKDGGYTLLQASIITVAAEPAETKTPLDHDTVNKDLDQVRERLKYIGQTAQYVRKAIPSVKMEGANLREKVTFLGIDGEFLYDVDKDTNKVENLFFKWSLSDYASDRDYAVNTLASFFGNEYETKDLSQYNKGNDCYSYDWWKTTDENWSVYLVLTDEDIENEGGSIQFTQLKS